MKHFKLIVPALMLLITACTYSQWTLCPGSSAMASIGSTPFISIVDQNTCWVAGGSANLPKVFKTTNSGVLFTDATGNLTGDQLFAIYALSATTCYVGDGGGGGGAGGNAKFSRTTDGGTTWTTVLTTGGTVGFINGVAFEPTNTVGFVESDAPTGAGGQWWAKTTNGGTTWTVGTPNSLSGQTGAAGAVFCSSPNVFGNGMSATTGHISITTNGGTTWLDKILSVPAAFVSGANANSDASIILGATNTSLPNISRSLNGGAFANVPVGGTISGLCVIKWVPNTAGVFYLCAAGATVVNGSRRSTDGGTTWTTLTTAGVASHNDVAVMLSGGTVYGYMIASGGFCLKLVDASFTGIDPGNTTTPTAFALQQNYPNPFNPTTNIKYSVPTAGNVTIKVYNSVGAEVMTVVNKNHNAGNYVETADMSGLSSGIYFYSLTAGSFTETKKMTLVK